MDIQRAKVDNGWLLFCVLVSLFTRIWKIDVSSLESWICGLLVPDTDSGDFIHIQNVGSRRHQALECYWKHDRTGRKFSIAFSIPFLIGAVISAALMISSGIVCQRILYLLHTSGVWHF